MSGLSADVLARIDALRRECLQIDAAGATRYLFNFSEAEVMDLASGYVPNSLKAAFRTALDWDDELQRTSGERPARKMHKRAR